jgi:hypothetical protein
MQVVVRVDEQAVGDRIKAAEKDLFAVWNSDERHVYTLANARHLEFDVFADKDEWSGMAFFKLEWLLAEPHKRVELQLEPQVRRL